MITEEIVAYVRESILEDTVIPYRWNSSELINFLNEGIDELCNLFLVTDSSTTDICEYIIGCKGSSLAEGTNSAKIKVVSAINYYVKAKKYTLAIQDNIAMTACAIQAVSKYAKYLISANSSGNVTITKGADASTQADTKLPALPSNQGPVGVLLIQTNATNTFTSGTTDLSAAGITATFLTATNNYSLDSRVIRIKRAKLLSQTKPIPIRDVEYMDNYHSDWENADEDDPVYIVDGKDTGYFSLWYPPENPDRISLTVNRKPLNPITESDLTVSPEIPSKYHNKLYNFIAYKCYGKPDSDAFNAGMRDKYFALWLKDIEDIKRDELFQRQEEVMAPPMGLM